MSWLKSRFCLQRSPHNISDQVFSSSIFMHRNKRSYATVPKTTDTEDPRPPLTTCLYSYNPLASLNKVQTQLTHSSENNLYRPIRKLDACSCNCITYYITTPHHRLRSPLNSSPTTSSQKSLKYVSQPLELWDPSLDKGVQRFSMFLIQSPLMR